MLECPIMVTNTHITRNILLILPQSHSSHLTCVCLVDQSQMCANLLPSNFQYYTQCLTLREVLYWGGGGGWGRGNNTIDFKYYCKSLIISKIENKPMHFKHYVFRGNSYPESRVNVALWVVTTRVESCLYNIIQSKNI